jgi:aryl-alcohol dehydrogenase-like predicted oxidoreductase
VSDPTEGEGTVIHTQLSTQNLDSPDFSITRLGFGAWAIDSSGWSFGWGPENDGYSTAAIRLALDLGVGWVDTGAVRSLGDSREPGAEHFSPADRTYVFAKCGLIFEEGHRTGEPKHSRWPGSIRQDCEASLRRLGVERIDLYQLCWPGLRDTRVEDSLRASMPSAPHRIGLVWYSPNQVDLIPETLSRVTTPSSAVAVAWTLTSPGVAGAIVGAGSSDQIEGWIDAATLVLSRANLGEIVTAIGRTGARRRTQLPVVLAA